MNRSYSKIRHIQESNVTLEKRNLKGKSLIHENEDLKDGFSQQMTYGELEFADSPAENIRVYVKQKPERIIYAFIKKDGENYYGKAGYELNFEGTNESYMVSDNYEGPEKTFDGWIKMKSYDDVDFYREFVERSFKLSDIKLRYLSHKM